DDMNRQPASSAISAVASRDAPSATTTAVRKPVAAAGTSEANVGTSNRSDSWVAMIAVSMEPRPLCTGGTISCGSAFFGHEIKPLGWRAKLFFFWSPFAARVLIMGRSNSSQRRAPAKELPSAPAGAYDDVSELLGVVVEHERRKGRGAHSNASGRYEPLGRVGFDGGWRSLDGLPPFKTTVTIDSTRKIITRNDSPDIGFDRSINPYRGCEHGCIYCFARPTHAYLGLSPGLDFESKLLVKPEAAALLEKELSSPGYE